MGMTCRVLPVGATVLCMKSNVDIEDGCQVYEPTLMAGAGFVLLMVFPLIPIPAPAV